VLREISSKHCIHSILSSHLPRRTTCCSSQASPGSPMTSVFVSPRCCTPHMFCGVLGVCASSCRPRDLSGLSGVWRICTQRAVIVTLGLKRSSLLMEGRCACKVTTLIGGTSGRSLRAWLELGENTKVHCKTPTTSLRLLTSTRNATDGDNGHSNCSSLWARELVARCLGDHQLSHRQSQSAAMPFSNSPLPHICLPMSMDRNPTFK